MDADTVACQAPSTTMTQLFRDNPVLTKELRVRMRGARAYWILTGYLLFLSFVLFFQYTYWWNEVKAQGHGFSSGSKIGQEFFGVIALVQAFLVAFITPAVTSGAITIEKEQRTLEMLAMTRLSRVSIVAGKLLSAVGFVALLLVSSLPLTSICFFLGGVSPEQVVRSYVLLVGGAFVAGALGLVWSSVARTTAMAVVLTYASIVLPAIVLAVLYGTAWGPLAGVQVPAFLAFGLIGIPSPDTPMFSTGGFFAAWDMRHYFALTLPSWLVPLLTVGLVGLLLCAIATVRLETFPERRGYVIRWLLLALFAQQCFFYFGARFWAFSRNAPPGLAAQMSGSPLVAMLFYPVLLLLLITPVFTTGEVRPAEARSFAGFLARGWTRAGWRAGRLNAGLPFLCALMVVVFGLYWLSFAIFGQPGAALTGQMQIPGATPTPRIVRVQPGVPIRVAPGSRVVVAPNGTATIAPTPGQSQPAPEPELAHVIVATFVSVLGLAVLGILFSLVTRNRWAAMMLSYATLFGIFVVPLMSRANFQSGYGQDPSVFINLFYLNPLLSIAQAATPPGTDFWDNLPLLWGQTPVWLVTTASWGVLMLAAVALALPFVPHRRSGVME